MPKAPSSERKGRRSRSHELADGKTRGRPRSRSQVRAFNPNSLRSDGNDNPTFALLLVFPGNPEATLAFDAIQSVPNSFRRGKNDRTSQVAAKQLILDAVVINLRRVIPNLETSTIKALETLVDESFHPTATGKDRFAFSHSGSNLSTWSATTASLPDRNDSVILCHVPECVSHQIFFVASTKLLDRQDDDDVAPVTAFFQPHLRSAYNAYTTIKKTPTPQTKKFLREFVRFADTVYLKDPNNFSSMVFMASDPYYVNDDADHIPADIPADIDPDPTGCLPSDGKDPPTQTRTVDPTPIDPTLNQTQEGSIHPISIDSEEPNVSHKKPPPTTALTDPISSEVTAMTQPGQPFLNETHLSTHSTTLPTAHGTFAANTSVDIPDISQPISTTNRDSHLPPTTLRTAPTTTPKNVKFPPMDKGVMDLISPDRSSRGLLGNVTTRFSAMHQKWFPKNKNQIETAPSPESPTAADDSNNESDSTLHPLDQIARDKSGIANWHLPAPQDISDITGTGPSYSNETVDEPTDHAPSSEHTIDLSSPAPSAGTHESSTRPDLHLALMNSLIREVVSSERLNDPRPGLSDTEILAAHITHHYRDNATIQVYSRDYYSSIDLAEKQFAFYRLKYFYIAHLRRSHILDTRYMDEDSRIKFLDNMERSLSQNEEFHNLFLDLMEATNNEQSSRIFTDIALLRYGIPMVYGPRARSDGSSSGHDLPHADAPTPKTNVSLTRAPSPPRPANPVVVSTVTDDADDVEPPRPRPGTPRPATQGRKLTFSLASQDTTFTGPSAHPQRHTAPPSADPPRVQPPTPRVAPPRIAEEPPRHLTADDISTLVSAAIANHLPSIMAGMHPPASPTVTAATRPPPVSSPPRPYLSDRTSPPRPPGPPPAPMDPPRPGPPSPSDPPGPPGPPGPPPSSPSGPIAPPGCVPGIDWRQHRVNPYTLEDSVVLDTQTISPWAFPRMETGSSYNFGVRLDLFLSPKAQFLASLAERRLGTDLYPIKTFHQSFPALADNATRSDLLSFLNNVCRYCSTASVYVPPLATMTITHVRGLWYDDLPPHCIAHWHFYSSVLRQALISKYTNLRYCPLVTHLLHEPDGYTILRGIAVAAGHPTLSHTPSTPREPRQKPSESLIDYRQRWLYFLLIQSLHGVFYSDRWFLETFFTNLHSSFDRLKGYLLNNSRDLPLNTPVPFHYQPHELVTFICDTAPRVGFSNLTPQSLPTDLKPGSSSFKSPSKSASSTPVRQVDASFDLRQILDDDDTILYINELLSHNTTKTCDYCGSVDHLLNACPKLKDIVSDPNKLRRLNGFLRNALQSRGGNGNFSRSGTPPASNRSIRSLNADLDGDDTDDDAAITRLDTDGDTDTDTDAGGDFH